MSLINVIESKNKEKRNKSNQESVTIRIEPKYGLMLKLLTKANGIDIKNSQKDDVSGNLAAYLLGIDNDEVVQKLFNDVISDPEFDIEADSFIQYLIKGGYLKKNLLKSILPEGV